MSVEDLSIPDEYLENLIIKGMLIDKHYTAMLSNAFQKDYFDNGAIGDIFSCITKHFKQYNKLPSEEIVKKSLNNDGVNEVFDEINSIEYDVAKNYEHLFHETNIYLKMKAFKEALSAGIDIVENNRNSLEFKSIIENALAKNLTADMGVNYWKELNTRLKRILSQKDVRVPSYYPILDEFIAGGFPVYTLSIILSRIHGFKSNFLINMASRQVLNGYSPLIVSLEMSEDAICQRLDSIYSGLNINGIYINKGLSSKMVKSLKNIKENNGLGDLIVKEFPTGKLSVDGIRSFIRELNYRGIVPNPIYLDYLQLVKSDTPGSKRYEELKHISEDLRALSLETNTPVISVSQLNREGMFTSFDEVDLTSIGGSIDIAATADFMAVFGQNEDDMVYKSELWYKILKNRLGGRVSETGKFFFDKSSLKVYDSSELNVWLEDAKVSGDDRKTKKMK